MRKNYLAESKKLYKLAESEFANAKTELLETNGIEYQVRQAAEKGWFSVVNATNALIEKKGLKVPQGTKKKENLLLSLEKKDKKTNELRIRDRYRIFLTSLHVDCFYEGDFSIKIVQRDLSKIKEYINDIEKM